ncbi:DUF4139 domain-containing protein [Pseudonocardia sp. GCM10023141]|uniref:DUF4139 domain-containing protein n=1 Tax=Pseudonocardia sp. GCM10023141 TaxID=3252653 RepID=UPI003609927A
MDLLAPIVAVTVHPERARITRRGHVTLPAGATDLVVAGLPLSLLDESVRVAGRSDAGVRVVGVDVGYRNLVGAPDDRVRAAEAAVRAAESAVATIDGLDAGDVARQDMLTRLAARSGDRLAAALADGTAEPGRVAEIGTAVAAQLVEVAASRRGHAERREEALYAVRAAQAELDRLRSSGRSRRDAVIGVESDGAGELELELTYVVDGAGWSPAYDARLDNAGQVALTWYGMVTQATGEDWPSCELTLSTARPAVSTAVPELDPWWIDVSRPPPPMPKVPMPMAAAGGARMRSLESADTMAFAAAAPVAPVLARAVETTIAASWRLARPTAVPGDATPHRTTVAAFTLEAALDHVVAPALGPDAHLRATVVNTSGQVLLAGPVSTFLDDAFVGTTTIAQTAPGTEIELALGVDAQVVVERELAERTAHRARFGAGRGSVERWTIEVTNRRATPTRVTVRDRIPVARQADIKIVEVALSPEPAERDELGRVEWVATLDPGATWRASVRFGVEHPKDLPITGWR